MSSGDDVEIMCKLCLDNFFVSSLVLQSRIIEICSKCYRNSTIKLNQEQLLFQPDHVIDNVYIGGFRCAMNLELLKVNNISRVLVCGRGLSCPFRVQGIEYLQFHLDDDDEQNISHCFDPAYKFITECVKGEDDYGGNVLIHCYAGVSRSATIVIAYLMRQHLLSLKDAKSLLRSKRPCISPNDGFISQLEAYEIELIRLPEVVRKLGEAPQSPDQNDLNP
jgi:predicted protein tyrosine phosphatase